MPKLIEELFAKYRWILLFAVLVALAAGIFAWFTAQSYSASLALTITRQGTQASSDYKYDDYYALKASDEFGTTVVGWFKTPEIASAVGRQAGLVVSGSLSSLSRKFQAQKLSPNLVEVRYGASSASEAQKIAQAIGRVIADKINLINKSSDQGIAFLAIAGEPVIVKNTFSIWLNVLAGFLIGLVFGIFVRTAKDYFR